MWTVFLNSGAEGEIKLFIEVTGIIWTLNAIVGMYLNIDSYRKDKEEIIADSDGADSMHRRFTDDSGAGGPNGKMAQAADGNRDRAAS